MELNLQKEQFSNAYLRAVAAAAGFQIYKPEPDIDKIDWGIAAPGPNEDGPITQGRDPTDAEIGQSYGDFPAQFGQLPSLFLALVVINCVVT